MSGVFNYACVCMHVCCMISKHMITVLVESDDDNLLLKAHLKTSRKKKHCISSSPPPSVPTPLHISHFLFLSLCLYTHLYCSYSPFQFLSLEALSPPVLSLFMFFLPSIFSLSAEMLRRQQRSDWIKIVWLMCSTLKRERENVKEAEMQEGKGRKAEREG